MREWLRARAGALYAVLAAAAVGLVLILRTVFLRRREATEEMQVREDYVRTEIDTREAARLNDQADTLRPRREALEAAAREIAARTPSRDVETMSADEIAAEYWRIRSGEKTEGPK